jgi:cytochrome c-type biogenesis protein CcmH
MILFGALAALGVAVALAFLLPPLLRARPALAVAPRSEANAAIYREHLEELTSDLARGAITQEQFDKAKLDLEHRIVSEHSSVVVPAQAGNQVLKRTAITIALLLPLVTALGYWQLGSPKAIGNIAAQSPHDFTPAQVEALVEQLAARMKQDPTDAEGWVLLGRSLSLLGRHERAAQAYAFAAKLLPKDAGVLADQADALAMAQGRRLAGEPYALVKRALQLDPENLKALALAGSAAHEAGDRALAIDYWSRILKLVPVESEFGRSISENIAALQSQGKQLQGTVSLDPRLKAKVSPDDTVFVLARPVSGSKMPLAIARTTVSALPYQFTLDDTMAMSPSAKLSGHDKVVVVARVSKSGKAAPEKGDIEGVSAPVAPGATGLQVRISKLLD